MAMINFATLMDIARRSGNPSVSAIIEVLNQTNFILDDIPWIECNSGVTHLTTLRTSLPSAMWRMLNAGVPASGSTTKQIKVGCGMLETYSQVDKKLVDLKPTDRAKSDFIASENAAFIEALGQEIARVIFYGDPSRPAEPIGLVNYYNDKSGETKKQIVDAGGQSTDNTSIWLIAWSPDSVHGIYPQGSSAGLKEEFLGQVTEKDAKGGMFEVLRTHYTWDAGLAVRDMRCAARIANISMAALGTESAPDIIDMLTTAYYRLPKVAKSMRKAFYLRPEILEALDKQARRDKNLMLNYQDVFGKELLTFRGIPLREQESLLDNEPRVV